MAIRFRCLDLVSVELRPRTRKLDSDVAHDETVYFLGGASSFGYANVTPDQVSKLNFNRSVLS